MARRQPGVPPGKHTVEAGDTLYDIAQAYYGYRDWWTEIARRNGNLDPNKLQIGQQLDIPPSHTWGGGG